MQKCNINTMAWTDTYELLVHNIEATFSDRKNGAEYIKQAMEIINDLYLKSGAGRYLFPSPRTTTRPMSENAVLSALRRMGYTKEEMTGHGFRSMASTNLYELGWKSELVEMQLAHKDPNEVRAAYNHAKYLDERIDMMQAWADYLDNCREDGKVIPLKRMAAND